MSAETGALERLLERLGGVGKKARSVTLGDAVNKGLEMGRDAYGAVRSSPKAAAIGAGAGALGGYGLARATEDDGSDDPEEQERLQRMLQYINGG